MEGGGFFRRISRHRSANKTPSAYDDIKDLGAHAQPVPDAPNRSRSPMPLPTDSDALVTRASRGDSVLSSSQLSSDPVPRNSEEEDSIKIVVLGQQGVGKSAIVASYFFDTFFFEPEHYETIEDTYRLVRVHDQRPVRLHIVEVGGSEELGPCRRRHIQDADAFVLVYSSVNRTSYERLHEIIDEIRTIQDRQCFPAVLVANKMDLRRQANVAKEEGQSLGQLLQATCLQTSGKVPSDGRAVFEALLHRLFSFDTQDFQGALLKTQSGRSLRRKTLRPMWFSITGQQLTWRKKIKTKKTQGLLDLATAQTLEDVDERTFRLETATGDAIMIQVFKDDVKKRIMGQLRTIIKHAGAT